MNKISFYLQINLEITKSIINNIKNYKCFKVTQSIQQGYSD